MTRIGVRSLIVRAGIAYGAGGGIASMFAQSARERGAATLLGDGNNRWAMVNVADLGRFVARAVESGRPGRAYNCVNDDHYTMREIAEAASRGAGAGGEVKILPPEIMGQFGDCLSLDQVVDATRGKNDLGWTPEAPSVITELEYGSYIGAALAS
jgi:nucleoside-diphosphate-sugar epimerase